MLAGAAGSQHALAAQTQAAAVTTSTVAYHLAAQFVVGPSAGTAIAGQVSGTLDSTGILTATLTLNNGLTSTVNGTVGASASLSLKGKAGTASLTGKLLSAKSGIVGGTLAQAGTADAGSWVLTPETQTLDISVGGVSSAASKDKIALSGQLTLQLTADGWGEGTFAFLNNNTVLQATGQVSNATNMAATVYWPGKGTLDLVATGKHIIGVLKWSGNFVGPAANDIGTFIAEG